MRTTRFRLTLLRIAFACACGILLGACASVSIRQDDIIDATPPKSIPDTIFVAPFTYYDPGVRVDRSGDSLTDFEQNLREKLTRFLVKRLAKSVAPTVAVDGDTPLPRGNYWLVTGRFDRVYQGSRILRMLIGLGAGGTKLETRVMVYDLSGPRPVAFLLLKTTGGSNISAGALTGISPTGITQVGMAINAVSSMHTGLTFDTIRTSHEITAAMSDYLREEGALPASQALAPKRLGHMPNFWPFNQQPERGAATGSVSVTPAAQ